MQYFEAMEVRADRPGANEAFPLSLWILIVLFALFGLGALYDIVSGLATNHIKLNLGVIQLFIAWGLWNRRHVWHVVAQVWLGLGVLGVALFLIMVAFRPGALQGSLFGRPMQNPFPLIAVMLGLIALACFIWAYQVLTREDIARLYASRWPEDDAYAG